MRCSPKTRWIIALLFLAIASQALVFAPGLHTAATILWGLTLACLIGARIIAVKRLREERTKSGK